MKTDYVYLALSGAFFSGLSSFLVGFFFSRQELFTSISYRTLFFLVINSLLITVGLILFYRAVSQGNVAVASALMSTKVLWTLLFSFLLLKEGVSFLDLLGIFFIVLGVILLKF